MSLNPLSGRPYLQETLAPYVTQTSLEEQFVDFAQDVETGTFSLPNTTDYFLEKPPTGPLNCNGKRVENIGTLPGLSLDSFLETPNTAMNVASTTNYVQLYNTLNTVYAGPLFSTISMKDKRLTNINDPEVIIQNDPNLTSKRKQGVNQGFFLDNSVSYGLRKANDGTDDVVQLDGAFNAFKYNNTFKTNDPQYIQGVKDPVRDFDAVNRRTTIVEDTNEVLDPVFNQPYNRLLANDRVLQLRDTIDPTIPPVPGTQWNTMISKQAITKSYADGKFHQKNKEIDFGNNKGVNCSNPTSSGDVATKYYCDQNRSVTNEPTNVGVLGFLGGLLGGSLTGLLTSLTSQGLASGLGSLASSGAAAFGSFAGNLFNGGMRVGSTADLNALKPNNPILNEGALIDNLKSDIANRPAGQPDVGSLVSGSMSVTGFMRANLNSTFGIFDI